METTISLAEIEEYWDRRPCNIRHSNKELGSKEYFVEVSNRRYFVEPHILEFMDLETWRGKNVLELGCGIGTDGAKFSENGALYSAIELSQSSLAIAQKRFELFNLEGKFFHSAMEDLDFKRMGIPSPDLVYCLGVLHHTVDPEAALKHVVRQCQVGTVFQFMLYARNSYKAALIHAGLDQFEAQDNCPVAYTYSVDDVHKLFSSAGLEIDYVKQDHIFPYEISEYKEYKYKKVPWFEHMPKEYFDAMKRNFGWHLLVRATKK